MSIFTEEHENIRRENGTFQLAEYYLDTIVQDKIDN